MDKTLLYFNREEPMKKILTTLLLLTITLLAIFAADTNAKLNYTVEGYFDTNFYISETEGTKEAKDDITVSTAIFTNYNQKVSYTFGIWDATRNNKKNQSYTLSVSTNGWRFPDGDIFAEIDTTFTPLTTPGSVQSGTKTLLVEFEGNEALDRTKEGTGAVKIATLKAEWTVPNVKYHLSGTYTAIITVHLESN